jgi:ketosteroid isomerase-like protein
MKKLIFSFVVVLFLSCNNETKTDAPTDPALTEKPAVTLPYTAAYSANWSDEVSDADLNTVLMSYKYWQDGNMSGLASCFADTVEFDSWEGIHYKLTPAEMVKMWTPYRDSLSKVELRMDSWKKMYATDKKDSYIVAWYMETDTYKTGKIDSSDWHDINQVKNGKITWYSQYRRVYKKK